MSDRRNTNDRRCHRWPRSSWRRPGLKLYLGEALLVLRRLPHRSVHCVVTSPPYWGLRDYQCEEQLGLEATPDEYVSRLVEILREVREVLRDDGTLFLNLGDSYYGSTPGSGGRTAKQITNPGSFFPDGRRPLQSPAQVELKPKDLVGMPWRVALALQADGWYLRQDIIWAKPNPMPESVTDRCTKSHEYLFLLSKRPRYYYDQEAVKVPAVESNASRPRMGQGPNTSYSQKRLKMKMPDGWDIGSGSHGSYPRKGREKGRKSGVEVPAVANRRSVWWIPTQPYPKAHFATFPEKLVEPCILAGCPVGGWVLDPFVGSGTTLMVALRLERRAIGIELQPEYLSLVQERIKKTTTRLKE